MTTYDYRIIYLGGPEICLDGCAERLDLDKMRQSRFFTLNFDEGETRGDTRRILINMAHVVSISEYEHTLSPDNPDDLRRALVLAHDDRTAAARLLGISERTLYRKIKENEKENKEL